MRYVSTLFFACALSACNSTHDIEITAVIHTAARPVTFFAAVRTTRFDSLAYVTADAAAVAGGTIALDVLSPTGAAETHGITVPPHLAGTLATGEASVALTIPQGWSIAASHNVEADRDIRIALRGSTL